LPEGFSTQAVKNATLMDWAINFLGFVPFGWLVGMLRRPRSGIILATFLAAVMSVTIEASQLLFLADRSPSTVDLLLNTLGASVGAWIAMNFDLSVSRRQINKSPN
jgi:VanZ family protein